MNKKYNYSPKNIIIRCLVIMLGVVITGYGAGAFVMANLGSDPVTAFVQGLGLRMGKTFGMAMNIFNVLCFVLILVFNRQLINFGTALYTFALGSFSDIFINLLTGLMGDDPSILVRGLVIVTGTIALGIGLGVYQSADFGIGPSDAINQTISQKTGIPLNKERIMFDAVMVVGAFFLGGTIGIGTIIGMFLVGPIMAPVMEKGMTIVNNITGVEHVVVDKE